MKVMFDKMVEARFYGKRSSIKDFVYEIACRYSMCGMIFQSTLLNESKDNEEIVFGRFEECYMGTIERLAEKFGLTIIKK